MVTPYFVELQSALHPDLNFTINLSSYIVTFSTGLQINCSSYVSGSFICFSKRLSFSQFSAVCALCILCQNILPLLPQFINLIRNIPIFLFAIFQPQKFLLQFFQPTVNLRNLLPSFTLQHHLDIFFQNRQKYFLSTQYFLDYLYHCILQI